MVFQGRLHLKESRYDESTSHPEHSFNFQNASVACVGGTRKTGEGSHTSGITVKARE